MENDFNEDNILNEPAARYGKSHDGITKSEYLAIVAACGMNVTAFSKLLPVSKRTIEKVKDQELLSPQVSDRVLQIAALYQFGSEILGSNSSFQDWMDTPIIALGGKKPISFLDRETGISMVNDTLGRIAYGVYA